MERAAGVVHTRQSKAVENKVYVAVEAEQGWSTLLWALQNLVNKGTTIVIAHVYCPAQTIPVMGEEVHRTMINPEVVDAYWKTERAKAEVKLDEYVQICTKWKFRCWKVTIEKDDVAKGLEELIALHGITKLVMGAAADERYSNALLSWNLNWSKTAYELVKVADKSCKIWFTCKGHLICTREGDRKTFPTPLPIGGGVCEAQLFREKIYEESTKRQKAERDLLCVLQMIGEWKMLHQHEILRRQAIEESYLRDRQEVKEMIQRFEAIYDQLDDAQELKQRVTEMESARKYHKEELALSKYSLEMLKADKEKLQLELDRCMTELESARKYHKEELAMSNYSLEMHKADKEKLQLDLDRCMIEMESARKYHSEEMASSRYIIETLQADKIRLQQKLDAALAEAEELRLKSCLLSASDADDTPPPPYFLCPISQEVMNDPHITADGFTYEGEEIRGWIESGHDTSPMTNLKLTHTVLIPNRALRSAILEWQQASSSTSANAATRHPPPQL